MTVELVPWVVTREALIESARIGREVWEKRVAAARVRYRSEIRKYRGIDGLRRQYRHKRGARW